MAKKEQKLKTNVSLENVVTTAIQVPGVKVNRELFLREQFQKESKELIESIVENGPVNAQVSQDVPQPILIGSPYNHLLTINILQHCP